MIFSLIKISSSDLPSNAIDQTESQPFDTTRVSISNRNERKKVLFRFIAEKTLGASTFCTYFESQFLVITLPKNYKETVSSGNSLSDLSQNTKAITENKNSWHGSDTSLNDEMEPQ